MNFYTTWAIGVIAVWLVAGLLFAISKYMEKHKNKVANIKFKISNINPKEEINKEFDRIFYRELNSGNKYLKEWDKIRSPLLIGYLCDGKIKYRHLMATLLNFIQNGYIEVNTFKDNQKNYILKKKNLEIYNPKVYGSIKSLEYDSTLRKKLVDYGISASDVYTINRIIFNDNNEVTISDIIKFYDDEDCDGKETEALNAKIIYLEKLINKEFQIYGIAEDKRDIMADSKERKKLTTIGIAKRSEWLNIANKLKKETLLANRDAQGLLVWGKYMIYGIALNVCKIAIKDIWNLFMQVSQNE